MLKINIATIPHNLQKYPTVGDWWWDKDGGLEIRVSDMGNWKYELLVAFHELAEVMLCKDRGIHEENVTAFDIAFEKLREAAPDIIGDEEPGDMVSAPYHDEHVVATSLERRLAVELGVNWEEYEEAVCVL